MKPLNAFRTLLLSALLAVSSAWSQHGDHSHSGHPPAPEQLGNVSFATSCSNTAQAEFNRAMALLHSFWFQPARESFARVLELDPACSMAYWGIAVTALGNPFAWPPNAAAVQTSAEALGSARRMPAKSAREREYIEAFSTYVDNADTREHRDRALALENAMRVLVDRYPDDDEARIYLALVLNVTAVPTDKTFAKQREAASILEPLFDENPDHPGIAHYLVHTHDYTDLADAGLEAARAYANIAPSVPHALHMPSHIFSRLGLWSEMIASNIASYEAAKAELGESTFGIGTYDALHAMDYLVYGYLQQAQDRAAQAVVDELATIRGVDVENLPAAYAFAAVPARYALERGDWQRAAKLELAPTSLAWNRFPQAEAILVFARGLGAARSGDVARARDSVSRLEALRSALADSGAGYWVGQTGFQVMALNAWIALAEGRREDALPLMIAAADAEDSSDKHPVTPGNVAPSREQLGFLLLELGEPERALQEFERSLQRDPNRLRGLFGAARAAELSNNAAAARQHYARLLELTASRDTEREEIANASRFLSIG